MSELNVIDVDKMADVRSLSGQFYRKSEADKVIVHHKYKRCLAMANWCEEVDLFGGYTSNYWMRWRNKLLKLAEKFKEVK